MDLSIIWYTKVITNIMLKIALKKAGFINEGFEEIDDKIPLAEIQLSVIEGTGRKF